MYESDGLESESVMEREENGRGWMGIGGFDRGDGGNGGEGEEDEEAVNFLRVEKKPFERDGLLCLGY